MVARFPERLSIIPRRIFKSRANQFAALPLSEERMQFSGSLGESSQKTRSGLIGSAEFMARASRTFHQSAMFLSIVSRHGLDLLLAKIRNKGRNFQSPAACHSSSSCPSWAWYQEDRSNRNSRARHPGSPPCPAALWRFPRREGLKSGVLRPPPAARLRRQGSRLSCRHSGRRQRDVGQSRLEGRVDCRSPLR